MVQIYTVYINYKWQCIHKISFFVLYEMGVEFKYAEWKYLQMKQKVQLNALPLCSIAYPVYDIPDMCQIYQFMLYLANK